MQNWLKDKAIPDTKPYFADYWGHIMSGIFKLLFYSPKKGERLFKPISHVALGDHGIKDGYHLLTAQLVESEVDSNIDYLIDELEKIRKEAKRKYKKANILEKEAINSRKA